MRPEADPTPDDIAELEAIIAGDVRVELDAIPTPVPPPHGDWTPYSIDREVTRVQRRIHAAIRQDGDHAAAIIIACVGLLEALAMVVEGPKRAKIERVAKVWRARAKRLEELSR